VVGYTGVAQWRMAERWWRRVQRQYKEGVQQLGRGGGGEPRSCTSADHLEDAGAYQVVDVRSAHQVRDVLEQRHGARAGHHGAKVLECSHLDKQVTRRRFQVLLVHERERERESENERARVCERESIDAVSIREQLACAPRTAVKSRSTRAMVRASSSSYCSKNWHSSSLRRARTSSGSTLPCVQRSWLTRRALSSLLIRFSTSPCSSSKTKGAGESASVACAKRCASQERVRERTSTRARIVCCG